METLREQLQQALHGRVCFVGLGSEDYGDDAFGLVLAERLMAAGVADVKVAGTTPDRLGGMIAYDDFDHIVFIDAADFGAAPGAVAFLGAAAIEEHFPQISTHKISLGLVAKAIESNGKTRVWMICVQPLSLKASQPLTAPMERTLKPLEQLLIEHSSAKIST